MVENHEYYKSSGIFFPAYFQLLFKRINSNFTEKKVLEIHKDRSVEDEIKILDLISEISNRIKKNKD